jgi:hypothetical protein
VQKADVESLGFRVYALSSSLYLLLALFALFVSAIYLLLCVFIPMLIPHMFTYISHLYSASLIKMMSDMRLEQT